jgi:hypothetical protein
MAYVFNPHESRFFRLGPEFKTSVRANHLNHEDQWVFGYFARAKKMVEVYYSARVFIA